jgi:hypothetical protein
MSILIIIQSAHNDEEQFVSYKIIYDVIDLSFKKLYLYLLSILFHFYKIYFSVIYQITFQLKHYFNYF